MIAADQAQAESHEIHKREFDRIRIKYGLDNSVRAGRIADLLANTDANEGVSAPQFAKMFGMSTEEAVVFLEWIKVRTQQFYTVAATRHTFFLLLYTILTFSCGGNC